MGRQGRFLKTREGCLPVLWLSAQRFRGVAMTIERLEGAAEVMAHARQADALGAAVLRPLELGVWL